MKRAYIVFLLLVTVLVLAGCVKKSKVENLELAIGKPYELINAERHTNINDPTNTVLTDGEGGNTREWQDPSWVGFKLANSAEKVVSIIIDLKKDETIAKVAAQFHQTLYGIDFPSKISVSLSPDKTAWSTPVVKEIGDIEIGTTDWVYIDINGSGRYVKLEITPKVEWVWCAEISVKKPSAQETK